MRWSVVRYGSHSAPLMMMRVDRRVGRRRELDVRRERRAAESDDAGVLHGAHDLVARQPVPVAGRGAAARPAPSSARRGCGPPCTSSRRDAATSPTSVTHARRRRVHGRRHEAVRLGRARRRARRARPSRTTSFAGLPACWRSGSTTSSGYGMRRIGSVRRELLVLRRMDAVREPEGARRLARRASRLS